MPTVAEHSGNTEGWTMTDNAIFQQALEGFLASHTFANIVRDDTAEIPFVHRVVELPSIEGHLIIDLNAADEICFIEVLGRPDVKYLLEEHYAAPK